jgi:hypothetical protein
MEPAMVGPGPAAMLAAFALLVPLARTALAQLRPEQVLVVYDSRVADSLEVAAYYAGSAAVPGHTGAFPGTRPGVRTVDLAALGTVTAPAPTITYAHFVANLRTPLRAHLTAIDPQNRLRCLVLTKGLPHRIDDTDVPGAGENFSGTTPVVQVEVIGGDATFASVDSELTLLFQNLNNNENGGTGDSQADGFIINPYYTQANSISAYSTPRRRLTRNFFPTMTEINSGFAWRPIVSGTNGFLPGDLLLVNRLDGPSVGAVKAMCDRALTGWVDVERSAIILDESRSNGTPDTSPNVNAELDNQDFLAPPQTPQLWKGDDYELARNFLAWDGRWNPAMVRYDAAGYPSNYLVGPRLPLGLGVVVSDPVALLASEGANSDGTPNGDPRRRLPESFNWAPMGVYNTIESFNLRDLGGLGSLFNQSQGADAIGAGATFAIGYVWEPFAQTIADNDQICRRFFAENQTWAEAAWASIPVLSWQHVVLGDPLARVVRSRDDLDGDGRVNIEDLYRYEGAPFDLNRSGSASTADAKLLERSVRPGAGVVDMVGNQR